MRSILFLSDSVNRRCLRLYDQSGLHLPNLERLARRSAVFDNHWTGSAPCMPARRDIMTGRLNFLERNWGPIEPIDVTLPMLLRENGVSTHMITDHYHYFEIGGEGYCQMFDEWELVRGQEKDPQLFPSGVGEQIPFAGQLPDRYMRNREQFYREGDRYPSAVTIDMAARWLEENHDREAFFLWVEPFDPHEPFEVPQKYLDMLGDDYQGDLYIWPKYDKVHETPEQLRHIRNRYLALLYMTDEYLGKMLDVMDKYGLWEDTAFVYTTDHGYMLGEHDYMAKNIMPAYNEVFHIPLVAHFPGDAHAGERFSGLTQNIDLLPTMLELYGLEHSEKDPTIHGKSLLGLLEGREARREAILYGYFGKEVNVFDGRYTYFRAGRNGNKPLHIYTSVPYDMRKMFHPHQMTDISRIEMGRFLSWTNYPVYRIPAEDVINKKGSALCYNHQRPWEKVDYLFDLETDPGQEENLVESRPDLVERMSRVMAQAMRRHDAPADQLQRLDLE